MKTHGLRCPHCGGEHVRRSRHRDRKERLRALLGIYPFRCRDCSFRFRSGVWLLGRSWYAKCPRCLRTELTTWSRRFYQATPWQNVQVFFGAERCRCSACRYNFVTFRPLLQVGQTVEASREAAAEKGV